MVSLARLSGAPLLPMFCVQGDQGAGLLAIKRPICIDHSTGREQALESAVRQYAALLEDYIQRYPHLYRNWHLLGEAGSRRQS
jgi:lauroyl/myristoyl acyltransferase